MAVGAGVVQMVVVTKHPVGNVYVIEVHPDGTPKPVPLKTGSPTKPELVAIVGSPELHVPPATPSLNVRVVF